MTTAVDKSLVARHEANRRVLDEHMEEFVKVGMALADIQKTKTYKLVDGYSTFEDWCNREYHFQKTYVYDVIAAAKERPSLPSPKTSAASGSFWNEYAIRTLRHRVPDPAKRQRIAKKVVNEYDASANGQKPKALTLIKKALKAVAPKSQAKKRTKSEPPTFDMMLFEWTGDLNGMANILDRVSDADLGRFASEHPSKANALAKAIVRLEDSMQRVWDSLPAKAKRV